MSSNENDEVWEVYCDCGYTIEGLTEERARRFAGQHGDAEHDVVAERMSS